MYIDDLLAEGYVLICDQGHEHHTFLVKVLGPSVQCPRCGQAALSVGLANEFFSRRAQTNAAGA